ncbi:glycosyltransferase family 2 protein [Alkalinema pantanalense CENA528]|uniref:glycosyltransferase family 2 protein n=1 Tax=Alkalinema pantanalense TaxID=1620705 RepID=UPI003D6EAAE5
MRLEPSIDPPATQPRWEIQPIDPPLPQDIAVSIVVATYDRPQDLQACLTGLVQQNSDRPVEIIVVDNHPASGMTPEIVQQFPKVKLVQEPRQGSSYARNAGILASRGAIVAMVDDDVRVPPDWLESLLAPFSRPEVIAVTGHILPIELETRAQKLFEHHYGGLGRGWNRREADLTWAQQTRWFSPPTWELGATANAAFRAELFNHPKVGLFSEFLGAGLPIGGGEDTYFLYRVVRSGGTLVYEPSAWVWHCHRRDMTALCRQVYNYRKGHVGHHLTALFHDGEWRGLMNLLVGINVHDARRIYHRLRGWSAYPIQLVLWEMLGTWVGPWALGRSYLRVKQLGTSRQPPIKKGRSFIARDSIPPSPP